MNTIKGFTLIELLVIISIIGLLSSIVSANVNLAREKGRVSGGVVAQSSLHGAYGSDAVAFFDFDDSTASVIRDSLGNGYNITMPSGCAIAVDSPLSSGKSLQCNTQVSFLPNSASDRSVTDEGNSFSFAMWVKPMTPITSNGGIIGRQYSLFPTLLSGIVMYAPGDMMAFTLMPGNVNNPTGLTRTRLGQDKWNFVVYVVDSVGDKIRFYVDGKLEQSRSYTGTVYTYGNSYPYFFGLSGFSARYDKVGFYRRALGLAEIQKMYAVQKSDTFANNTLAK